MDLLSNKYFARISCVQWSSKYIMMHTEEIFCSRMGQEQVQFVLCYNILGL